jgi:hypothetical protein
MNQILKKYLLVSFLIFSGNAAACSFDNECRPGMRCVKTAGSMFGHCLRGVAPTRDFYAPAGSHVDKTGVTVGVCDSDADCGLGSCIKLRRQMHGVCR